MSFAGKVILVTGGSRGIGKAIVERFASEGASVVVNYANNAASANELVQTIGSDRALAVQADVSTLAGVQHLVDETVKRFGKIDVLIPNAGVTKMGELAQVQEEDFDRLFATNVKGVLFLCQKATPHIPPGGRIILTSTGVTAYSAISPNYLIYAATKGAIEQFTRLLAKDLARQNINVNAVAPGPTGTDLFYEGKSEQVLQHVRAFSPFNKFGEPAQIAAGVAFLAGRDADWISGQILRIDGGMTCA